MRAEIWRTSTIEVKAEYSPDVSEVLIYLLRDGMV